jgi:hypothetical protein
MTSIVTPYDFLICDANHDGLGLVSQFKNGNITGIINTLASGCNFNSTNTLDQLLTLPSVGQMNPSSLYPNGYFNTNKAVTENPMVQLMFGSKKKDLKRRVYRHNVTIPGPSSAAMGPPSFYTLPILCITDPQLGIRTIHQENASMVFLKNDQTHGVEDSHTWNTIFSLVPVDANGNRHVYLVCDSASHFIRYMSDSPNVPINLRVHCMFSSSTYADPSSLITRDSPNILAEMVTNQNNAARSGPLKFTHTYREPINVGRCNKISMLDTTIQHVFNPVQPAVPTSTTVNETITYHNIQLLGTNLIDNKLDARNSTSQPNILADITANSGGIPFNRLRIAQAKRLGDHNQIGFIKYLCHTPAGQAVQNCNRDRYNTLIATTPLLIPQEFINQAEANANLNCNSTNTFFVTQDWPAFCWAVYNKINAILITDPDGTNPFKGFLIVYW